jgi:hypothetical protein
MIERARARRRAPGGPWSTPEEGALLLRTILGFVAYLRGPIALFGIDYPCFRELLRARLVLTQRTSREGSKVWGQMGAAIALLMTWFAGLGLGLTAILSGDGGLWVLLSQAMAMLMLAVLLFQVLTPILIDPSDIQVVAARPVRDRTVFAVRLAEVSAYVLVFASVFASGGMVLALFAQPPFAVLLVYPLLALSAAVVALGGVTALFAACLRVAGPTHFQRVALWLQILGGVGIFVAFHAANWVPREQWALWASRYEALRYLFPPFSYAEIFRFACGGSSARPWRELALAMLLPVAALGVTLWLASRYFVAGLQGTLGAATRKARWEGGWLERIGAQLCDREERAGFAFALAYSRREPHFLRTVLPQLVMFQAMAIGSGFGLRRDLDYFIPASSAFLFLVLPNILLQAQSTAIPEARVLFTTTPLASEDALLRGGVKALLLQWVGVPALALLLVQLWAGGPRRLPDIWLAFGLSFTGTLVFTRQFRMGPFFTRGIRMGETSAANLGLILLMGLGMGAVVGLHVLLSLHPLARWGGILASSALLVVLWRRLADLKVAPDRRLMVPRTGLVLE